MGELKRIVNRHETHTRTVNWGRGKDRLGVVGQDKRAKTFATNLAVVTRSAQRTGLEETLKETNKFFDLP